MSNVNHPSHYADGCSMECIDVMELVFGKNNLAMYSLINAFKYVWRWKNKNGQEDLDKAAWYLNEFYENIDPFDRYVDVADKLKDMIEQINEEKRND